MAIFNLKSIKSSDSPFRTRYFNELQVNGEDVNDTDDFTIDDEESEDDESANTGENTPEDAAQDAAENPSEEDNQAAKDLGADTTDDDEDDFTLDDEDDSSTAEENEAPATEENTETPDDDFTMDDENQSEGEANAEDSGDTTPAEEENNPDEDGDDTTTDDTGADDFTMDDSQGGDATGGEGEADAEGNGDTGDAGSDTSTADSGSEAPPADPSDNISDEDVKAAEEQIYDSLTDDQKRIRVLQLKIDYKDLYETIITTKEGINSIPKTMDNLDTIKRLTLFTEKTKGILIDYIQNNFDKNPYLENYAMYVKFMAVFRTIYKVIEELNAARK